MQMAITTLSSHAFQQDASIARKAANAGPVFITDRGEPTHVLLSIADYQRLLGHQASIADMLAMPGAANVEFHPPRAVLHSRAADL